MSMLIEGLPLHKNNDVSTYLRMNNRIIYKHTFMWQNINVTCELNRDFFGDSFLEAYPCDHETRRRPPLNLMFFANFGNYLVQTYLSEELLNATNITGSITHHSHHLLKSDDFTGPFGEEINNNLLLPAELEVLLDDTTLLLKIQVPLFRISLIFGYLYFVGLL